MLVTCHQMQQIEHEAFDHGVSAARLMEEAGCGIAREVQRFFPHPGTAVAYLGTGNNAGDALVAARELEQAGWTVALRLSHSPDKFKPLPLQHWQRMTHARVLHPPIHTQELPQRPIILLDGLVGIGVKGPLRPELRKLAVEMNQLRRESSGWTVAIDLPSGLDGDTGEPSGDTVVADLTVTVGFPKVGLVADTATAFVGRLAWIALRGLEGDCPLGRTLLTPQTLRRSLPRRSFDFHKGQAGRVGILAGSSGFLGAAELVCSGALRAGAGLVTLFAKDAAYSLLASRIRPEVMVKPIRDYREVLDHSFDALGIGPGLGFDAEDEVLDVIRYAEAPTVVDADALTLMARAGSAVLLSSTAPRLLTPHPGEMKRLVLGSENHPRVMQAEKWAMAHPGHTLLLKGARTVIATGGKDTFFNTTGHPGMATGGMGDVLTGVCAALVGQKMALHEAAGLAAWACGRAAELAATSSSQLSVLPSDVAMNLGQAFHELE